MKYGSVCSGIEAASVAWEPMGWEASFLSDIDPFPRALLKHHYPDVPLHGDFTTIKEKQYGSINLLVGGTPCQSFSVAGLQKGMDDDRGNLALEFLRLAQRESPDWLLWENVPGVLSSNEGRDFAAFLGGLAKLGYGFAYRVLDAKYYGVPQERRRVFVVGYRGSWQRAGATLFESKDLQYFPRPLGKQGGNDPEKLDKIYTISSAALDRSHDAGPNGKGFRDNVCYTLTASDIHAIAYENHVRYMTPLECERCQGFPDNYTLVPYRGGMAKDAPRYKALGNSMAVPVMRWIGEQINCVQQLIDEEKI